MPKMESPMKPQKKVVCCKPVPKPGRKLTLAEAQRRLHQKFGKALAMLAK